MKLHSFSETGSADDAILAEAVSGSSFYHISLIPLVIITVVLAWRARPSTSEELPPGFLKFQLCYLSVWSLCAAADWLQGPYVYALYSAYGFSRHEIAQLFVAGFASSLVFSCLVGAVCDRFGRKRCAVWYCLLYIFSCLTKHVKSFGVLMLGRITGGIATSLLFSCFECWMVSEHATRKKFSGNLLSYMFGLMYTVNYLVAILSGVVGEVLADRFTFHPSSEGSRIYFGGDLGPFDLSILCLLLGGLMITFLWDENYGQDGVEGEEAAGNRQSVLDNLLEALSLLRRDSRALLLGLAVACFEGSMYAFVFNWTPALESAQVPPPYGLIFALFMMACMCGASVSTLLDGGAVGAPWRLFMTFAAACGALVVAAATSDKALLRLIFAAFCVFEFCVGVYFPTVGMLKSQVVPEKVRGTVYNLYRVPLNAVVVVALLTNMNVAQVLAFCACLMAVGLACVGIIACRGRCVSGGKAEPQEVKVM